MKPRLNCLEESWHHPYGEKWWWQHNHTLGMFFSDWDWETSQDRGKDQLREVHSPLNLTELERICREEWEKLSKYRCSIIPKNTWL